MNIVQPIKPGHIQFERHLDLSAPDKKASAISLVPSQSLRTNLGPRLDNNSAAMGYGNVGLNASGSVTDNDDGGTTSPMPLEARKAISQEMQYSDMPLQQV